MKEILVELSKKYPNNMVLGSKARQSENPEIKELALKFPNDMEFGAQIRKIVKE